MALVPPPNAAGVIPPANPQNPPTLGDITNSKEYIERLALSKRCQIPGATATDNDIGSAERYHQNTILSNTMMGAVPPPWLAPFMAAPPQWLAQAFGNLNQNLANLNQNVACIAAQQANGRISRLNKLEIENNSGLVAYRAKQKEIAGDGILLANALLPMGFAPLVALPVVPAIGATIAATISPTILTHQGILNLIQFYNFNFGIQQNDLVAIRCQRILNWLTTDI